MNFDNGHRQRQGQHNKRGRGRNNRRSGGGGGGQHGGGGNSPNRVYESNGPDVKVRGTAQTIAEKYMQLGRDAHSSGDNVMAESYYQFAEHYFRVLQAAQPPGQLAPQILRRPGEESEEEVEVVEAEDGSQAPEGAGEGGENAPAPVEGETVSAGEGAPQGERQEFRPREHDGRDNRERFRPRWQQRRDNRDRNRDGQPRDQQGSAEGGEGGYNGPRDDDAGEQDGNWEAPSFLKRPAPVSAGEAAPAAGEDEGERRPQRGRRGRPASDEVPADTTTEE